MAELPKPGVKTICPYCGTTITFNALNIRYPRSPDVDNVPYSESIVYEAIDTPNLTNYRIWGATCPACNGSIIIRQKLVPTQTAQQKFPQPYHCEDDLLLWPRGISKPIPENTPSEIARDFKEACETLYVSKRASAALSRRCLQNLLREKEGVHKKNLYEEIEKVINSSSLLTPLQNTLHMIRNLGAVGTHPLKDLTTGKILDIEEGEAELMIDVLTDLLDYYARIEKYKATATTAQEKVNKQKRAPKL